MVPVSDRFEAMPVSYASKEKGTNSTIEQRGSSNDGLLLLLIDHHLFRTMSTNLLFNKLRHSIAGRTAKIPKDRLRPEYTFGPILQQFVDARAKAIESRKEPTEGDLKTLDKSLAMLNSNGWRKKVRPLEP
jgi:hypothetical protein